MARLRTARPAHLLLGVAAAVAVTLALVVELDDSLAAGTSLLLDFRRSVTIAAGSLLFGAGLIQRSTARVSDTEPYNGVVLVVVGLTVSLLSGLGHLLHVTRTMQVLNPLVGGITLLTAVGVIAAGARLHSERPRPLLVTLAALAFACGAFTALVLATQAWGLRLDLPLTGQLALQLVLAAGWIGVAASASIGRPDDHLLLLAAALAAGWLFKSIAVFGGAEWIFGSSLLFAVTSIAILTGVLVDFSRTSDAEHSRLDSTEQALEEVAAAFARLDHERRNFAHDARNVILALQAASQTLADHGDQLDAEVRTRLRLAIVDELDQLHRMLTNPASTTPDTVEVHEVISTVVATERMNGLDVQLELEPCMARIAKQDLTRVLRNLLVNAREHAPRSPVLVRAAAVGGSVRISVEDRGPGVPSQLRRTLFDRGVSTKAEASTGLGLNVSRALMREQGGDLELTDGPAGGSCFVLTLPSLRSSGARAGCTPITALKAVPAQERRSA